MLYARNDPRKFRGARLIDSRLRYRRAPNPMSANLRRAASTCRDRWPWPQARTRPSGPIRPRHRRVPRSSPRANPPLDIRAFVHSVLLPASDRKMRPRRTADVIAVELDMPQRKSVLPLAGGPPTHACPLAAMLKTAFEAPKPSRAGEEASKLRRGINGGRHCHLSYLQRATVVRIVTPNQNHGCD